MASANKRRSAEVDDPVVAFQKLEDFGRRILAVPKRNADVFRKSIRKKIKRK